MKNFNNKIVHLKKTDSTQDYAKGIAPESPSGTVVLAEEQTGGRGQFERKWSSLKGGLYFSLILKPGIKPQEIPLITFKMSLAIIDALKKKAGKNCELLIKPPNDVVVKKGSIKRKIAGILTESSIKKGIVEWVVVGVGVNVANELPWNLASTAVSLNEMSKKKNNPSEILAGIIKNFKKYYFISDKSEIIQKYYENLWK